MPRTRRLIPESGPIHIICRGNNKKNILGTTPEKSTYLSLLEKFQEENNIVISHYSLMDNHVHMIIWLESNSKLSRYMLQVDLAYFHYFHKKYNYCGHLWQNRFTSSIIDTESYLLQCAKYIELNPVRAGIVKAPHLYPFSSYRFYTQGEPNSLITPNPLYLELSHSQKMRQRIYQNIVVKDSLKTDIQKEFLGDSEFIKKMEDTYKIRATKRKRGRPRLNK
jgi:putative transposase